MAISPSRLTLARKLRGLTLAELARRTDLSTQTINRYENGRQEPTSSNLQRLSTELALPVEFFEREEIDPIPIGAVSFRALSKTPAFRRDAALNAGELAIDIARWISTRYRLPEPGIPSYSVPAEAPIQYAEVLAARLRSHWDLGSKPISNMVHLLEARGVRVFSLAQDVRDVDAFSFFKNSTPYVFIDTGKTAERQRFDAAHELGHLVMHQGSERPEGREAERQADRFAAAFLMPREDVLAQHLRNASASLVIQASRRWKVSAMALAHRLSEMSQLTEWGYRSVVIELSQQGYRRSEPGSTLIPESSQVLEKVFAHLRTQGGVRSILGDLKLPIDEFNRHVFGLVKTVHIGGKFMRSGQARAHLRVVGDS